MSAVAASAEEIAEVIGELRALAAEVREDLAPQELELKEIGVLIRQAVAEVDRVTPLRNDAARRVREMESNIEHFSRSDIAESYAASNEAQMRLFMMQSRLEQLEYKQRTLERNRRNLLRFASLVEQLPTDSGAPDSAEAVAAASPGDLVAQMVQVEEDERQRCAIAIHDGAAQVLTNLVLRAQLCERLLDTDEARARQELGGLHEALAAALQDVRRLIYDLRPLVLEDVGLLPSIQKYIQSVADRSDTPVELRLSQSEQRLPLPVETALFRLVQEAVGNALSHSRAKHVQVTVHFADDAFRALVEDDGIGFDPPASIAAARQNRQLGLAMMLERAALLDATLTFDSAPGRGTRVRIDLPLAEGASA